MILDGLNYLLAIYWPYMLGAFVVGLGAGWFSYTVPKR